MSGYEKEPLLIEQKVGKNVNAKKDSKKMAEFKESKWRSKAKCQGNLNSHPDPSDSHQSSHLIQENKLRNNQLMLEGFVRDTNNKEKIEDKSKILFEFFSEKRKMNEANPPRHMASEKKDNRMQQILKKVQEKKNKIEQIMRDGLSRYNREVEEIEEEKSLESDTQTAKFNDISSQTVSNSELQVSKIIKQVSGTSIPSSLKQATISNLPNNPSVAQNLHQIRQNLLQRRLQASNNVQLSNPQQENVGNDAVKNDLFSVQAQNQPMNINKILARNAIEATKTFIRKDQSQRSSPSEYRPTAMNNIFSAQPQNKNISHSPSPGNIQNSSRQIMSPRQKPLSPHKPKKPQQCNENSLNFPLLEIMAGCLAAHWPSTLQHEWGTSIKKISSSSTCQQYSTGSQMIDENWHDLQAMACATVYRQKLKEDYISLCNGSQESSQGAQTFEHGSGNINASSFRQKDYYQQIERQRMEEVSEEVYKEELYRRIMSMNLPIPPLFDNNAPPYFNPNYAQEYNPNQQGTPFRPTPYYVPPPHFQPRHTSSLFSPGYHRLEQPSNQATDYYSLRRANREPPCPSYRQIKMRRISEYYHEGLANRARKQEEDELYRPFNAWNRWQQ